MHKYKKREKKIMKDKIKDNLDIKNEDKTAVGKTKQNKNNCYSCGCMKPESGTRFCEKHGVL